MKESLRQHARRNHSEVDEHKKKCLYCVKSFTSIAANDLHMKQKHTHTYKCEECDFQTFKKIESKLHQKKHNKFKPYRCGQCASEFSLKSYLISHEKNYHVNLQCDTCSVQFPSRTEFVRHMKGHLPKKHLFSDECCNDCKRLSVMEALALSLNDEIREMKTRLQQQ